MTTIPIKEFKARASAILRELDPGQSVIVTRHGKPCAKVTGLTAPKSAGKSVRNLRGSRADLPDLEFEDFLALKQIWGPKPIESGESGEVGGE